MTAALQELLARVEAATGSDVALEWAIWRHFNPEPDADVIPIPYAPYTLSVDEAISLVERVMPPAWVRLDSWYDGSKKVAAILPKPTPNDVVGGVGVTIPLAILAALLKALIAKGNAASAFPDGEIAETDTRGDHCPNCGYTLADCQFHGDHRLCDGPGPRGWVRQK